MSETRRDGATPGKTPLGAWLIALGAAAITAVVSLAAGLRAPSAVARLERDEVTITAEPAPTASASASASAAPTAAPGLIKAIFGPSTASASELSAARVDGVEALDALAKRFPKDPAVLKALVLAHASDKKGYAAALEAARQLFEVDEAATRDPDLKQVLFMAANGPVDAATVAIDLMGTAMGSRGPDLLYELLSAPSVGKFPKTRATALIESDEVRALASPALLIAYELRTTSACKRGPLLAKASEVGDKRALGQLRPLLATRGCGFLGTGDCYRCLGSRAEVRKAIASIEKRLANDAVLADP